MKKFKWQRKYLYNGRTPHTLFPHDYSSNSNLWIQNRSFKVPKNGWEIYDNDTFIVVGYQAVEWGEKIDNKKWIAI